MSNQDSTRVRWDPSSLVLDGVAPSQAGIRRGRRASSVRGKFIAGPVDVVWLSQARKLGVTALWVGLGLWFLRGLRRSNSFTVSNLMMREWGVQQPSFGGRSRAVPTSHVAPQPLACCVAGGRQLWCLHISCVARRWTVKSIWLVMIVLLGTVWSLDGHAQTVCNQQYIEQRLECLDKRISQIPPSVRILTKGAGDCGTSGCTIACEKGEVVISALCRLGVQAFKPAEITNNLPGQASCGQTLSMLVVCAKD
jgi:hypothetical protein